MKKETYEKMEEIRNELNLLIEKKADYAEILEKSQELDKYFLKAYNEGEIYNLAR